MKQLESDSVWQGIKNALKKFRVGNISVDQMM